VEQILVKKLKSNDPNIVVKFSGSVTRHNSIKNILTNVPRVKHLIFQSSYFNRAAGTYNCLPSCIRHADITIGQFKSYMLKFYHEMTELIQYMTLMYHNHLKLSVLNVTRVVLCRTIVNIMGGFGRRANLKGTRDFCLNILRSTPRDLLWCTN
jgi:hypothetical protein